MDRITQAFQKYDRSNFVLPQYRQTADVDEALPIGQGQTISQPSTVRMMLEWLDIHPGQQILDVGSGSGWTTALLAFLASPKGWVYGIERIPELLQLGKDNCFKAGVKNASFFAAGDATGLEEYAPYDRILVSASADEIPESLKTQLSLDGKMVIPVHNDIHVLTKLDEDKWDSQIHPGFAFVPLL